MTTEESARFGLRLFWVCVVIDLAVAAWAVTC